MTRRGLSLVINKQIADFRKRKANPPKQVNNAALYAGSPMFYYCQHCGHQSDVIAEGDFSGGHRRVCYPCRDLLRLGLMPGQERPANWTNPGYRAPRTRPPVSERRAFKNDLSF